MLNNSTHALSTSLLHARLGLVATLLPTEQQLVERLCSAARSLEYPELDVVRALYVGLKLRLGVCLHGVPAAQTMHLLDKLAATIVGAGSDQIVRLHVPTADDTVARRFSAMRISELISSALDPTQGDKAWFLLLHGDDATASMMWVEQEIAASLDAGSQHRDRWPENLMVLVAASNSPTQCRRHWLTLRAAQWTPKQALLSPPVLPPVGCQRQLVAARLCGSKYMHWLREARPFDRLGKSASQTKFVSRWLAAAVDAQGQGLWNPGDRQANIDQALAVFHAFVDPAP